MLNQKRAYIGVFQDKTQRIKPAPTLKSHKHLELSCNKKVRVVPDLIAISVPFYTIHDDLRSHSQWYYRVQETSERAKRGAEKRLSFFLISFCDLWMGISCNLSYKLKNRVSLEMSMFSQNIFFLCSKLAFRKYVLCFPIVENKPGIVNCLKNVQNILNCVVFFATSIPPFIHLVRICTFRYRFY